jgi:hypothetical protein
MPRASYAPKNRFCFNSNLSEWAYLKLMYLWLRGETFTDIETMLPADNHQFDWIMERVNTLLALKEPIARDEPVTLSRQSCHRVIDQFAQHYMADHVSSWRGGFDNFEALADSSQAKAYPSIMKVLRLTQKLGLMGFVNSILRQFTKTVSAETINQQALKLATGEIDHGAFQTLEKTPSPATIIGNLPVWLVQQRYKRFRGYDREKMTPHTVNQMLTIQAAQDYFKRIGKQPEGSPSDWTKSEMENWRTNSKRRLRHTYAHGNRSSSRAAGQPWTILVSTSVK